MLSTFRAVSFIEGLSYLVILSVTLGYISRDFVYPLGMFHGALFIAYLAISLLVSNTRNWSLLVWLGLFLASLIPFAFLPVEWFLKKEALKVRQELAADSDMSPA